ncbi:MAG TPA: phosphoribosyltransferase, partial [Anaerolineae bacterium]|nr:phosphoribosyltransferase [Anaerolineae bacterium]
LDHDLIRQLGISEDYIERETERQRREIERRAREYRGDRPPLELADKTVVVVDDGVATGATTMATLRALQKQEPKELILAIPVGPPDTVKELGKEADRVICLSTPRLFWAVGAFYAVFDQTPDEKVKRLLEVSP